MKTKQKLAALIIVIIAAAIALGGMTALIIIQAIIAAAAVSAGVYITVTGKEITISYGKGKEVRRGKRETLRA